MFEKNMNISFLLDFYGDVLDEKPRTLLDLYYNEDLSLAEIAESEGMTRQGVRQLGTEGLDLVILENVGNLVCPAEFDTGAAMNMMILSVPEGHDKPLKYPLIFQRCGAMIVNKTDVLPYFDFDLEKVTEFAHRRNPDMKIFPISAKTGDGVEALADWLCAQIRMQKEKMKETRA